MIEGLGIDMVKVSYINRMLKKHGDVFLHNIYAVEEIRLYGEKKRHVDHFLAGRFAAKEALLKALGTGMASGLDFNQIEVCNNAAGKPFVNRTPSIERFLEPDQRIQISISHHEKYAVAVIIIERVPLTGCESRTIRNEVIL
ncbi:holo-ACP synthase [Gorillibacterium sp. CAU 1737]|uniref:holo-ACP synthase n=1 Tax=Gorillibacterium sp. CAU 1737 TaxID=3140362 RepID=UPI0032600AFC